MLGLPAADAEQEPDPRRPPVELLPAAMKLGLLPAARGGGARQRPVAESHGGGGERSPAPVLDSELKALDSFFFLSRTQLLFIFVVRDLIAFYFCLAWLKS